MKRLIAWIKSKLFPPLAQPETKYQVKPPDKP
jgi:hypothetical protein